VETYIRKKSYKSVIANLKVGEQLSDIRVLVKEK
jgi:hypothetical protein